jgi:homoserine O-acetyltransferase
MKTKSVGIVKPLAVTLSEEIQLESGKSIDNVTIAYETYGKLNKEKNNAILVCHALTGDAHAAGWHEGDSKPGWWEIIIGPGKALDSEKYFIICSNVLGGCKGTTGPASINPETGKEYGIDFPVITLKDIVNVEKKLIDLLGIEKLLAVIGGSMGGMQTLQWTLSYPEMVKKAIPIATTARSSPQQIAFNEVGRQSIIKDPFWQNGEYYQTDTAPEAGLSVARMIAHITYLSDESMYLKFGRDLQDKDEVTYDFTTDFQVESYLHHQGKTFVKRFDANSYLYITKAIDLFDLSENGSLIDGFKPIKSKIEYINVDSDWLYTNEQAEEILRAMQANGIEISYSEIKSNYGHDAFLLEGGQLNYLISRFLQDNIVEDLMNTEVMTITEDAKIKKAAKIMMDHYVTHLPVVTEDNKLIGIITAWDLSKAIAQGGEELKDVMTEDVKFCKKDETIRTIAGRMKDDDISCLPVIDDNDELIGVITTDLISHLFTNTV